MASLFTVPAAIAASAIILACFMFMKTNRYSLPLVALPLALLPTVPAWIASIDQIVDGFRTMAKQGTGGVSLVTEVLLESNRSAQLGYTASLLPLILLMILGAVLFWRGDDESSSPAPPFRTYVIIMVSASFFLLAATGAGVGIRTLVLPLPVVAPKEALNEPDLPMMARAKETLDLDNESTRVTEVSQQISNHLVAIALWSFVMLHVAIGCFILSWILSLSFSFSREVLMGGCVLVAIALSGTGIQIGRHRALDKEIRRVVEMAPAIQSK